LYPGKEVPMPRKYKQIAMVVRDLDRAMKNYWELLGIGPWDVRHFTPKTARGLHVYGKRVTEDFDFACAVTWEGEMELELIQPIKGPNIYWKFLEEHGEGIHHFKEILNDEQIPGVIEDFAKRGITVLQTAWLDGDVHYYLDTEPILGMVYEVGNGGEIGPPERRFP
jgi:hypothetical protein